MITIKDVAQRAGVSPGTVSNALSGNRPVSAATRARIFQVIEELGYQPNLLARSLVNQRSHTIAVVTSEVV
ncbi:MAG: LacI family transcriptional regulator, partial [Caldilineae bacterium]